MTTYGVDELLGTKLRALYQRKKGRDLFDLWHAFERGGVDADAIVRCFRAYLALTGLKVSQAEFATNLDAKAGDSAFREDVLRLLEPDVAYDQDEALGVVRDRLLARL